MRATFSDEQEALASTVRDLAKGGRGAARQFLDGGTHPEEPTKSLLAGFAGLAVAEAEGGAGGDLVDLAIVLEGLGRQVTPTPYVSHVLAVQVAHAAGLDVAAAAAGKVTWTLAVDGGRSQVDVGDAVRGEQPAVRDGAGCDASV
ncbi:MAG: acyl-CoA dehydrogenase family protein, partial [Nitriliruptorales bacterium]